MGRFRRALVRLLGPGVATALVVLAASAGAEPPGPPRHGPPHHGAGPPPDAFIARNAERLDLDEKTRDAIRAIADDSRSASEAGRAELHAAHERLQALLREDAPDEAAVLKQADVIGALENEERRRRLAAMLAIRSLLSDEQRAELVRIRDETYSEMDGPPERRWKYRGPCDPERERLCADTGSGADAMACLSEHWDDLTPRCRSAFE